MDEAVELFRALGDQARLRIISLLLAQKEEACVCELVDALRIPQYQVSRQLSLLRHAGLVTGQKRGTWVYYGIRSDLPALARAILDCLAAHLPSETTRADRQRFKRRLSLRRDGVCIIGYEPGRPFRESIPVVQAMKRVLFVCTHNSARSQMAEALLRHHGGDRFEAFSAGTEPRSLHPFAVRVMAEIGVDISEQLSKSVDQFVDEPFDFVITVCDQAGEACPLFPGAIEQLHWSFSDPSAVEGSEEERLEAFHRVRDEIAARVRDFVSGQRAQEAPP